MSVFHLKENNENYIENYEIKPTVGIQGKLL